LTVTAIPTDKQKTNAPNRFIDFPLNLSKDFVRRRRRDWKNTPKSDERQAKFVSGPTFVINRRTGVNRGLPKNQKTCQRNARKTLKGSCYSSEFPSYRIFRLFHWQEFVLPGLRDKQKPVEITLTSLIFVPFAASHLCGFA
jgi:hypothetical protein